MLYTNILVVLMYPIPCALYHAIYSMSFMTRYSSRHDPLTIMDSTGRVVSVRSGREWSDWSSELRMSGDELRWKFMSDGSVNGWGWRCTVYPIPPAAAPCDVLSDRALQSRPSIDLVRCFLGK